VLKRNNISLDPKSVNRNMIAKSIPSKNIRISPYSINWNKQP
jgi:hypothetical protein